MSRSTGYGFRALQRTPRHSPSRVCRATALQSHTALSRVPCQRGVALAALCARVMVLGGGAQLGMLRLSRVAAGVALGGLADRSHLLLFAPLRLTARASRSRVHCFRYAFASRTAARYTRYAGGRRASGRGAAGAPHPTHYAPQSQRGAEVGSLGRAQEPLQFLCQLLQHEEERHANRVGGRQRRRTPTTSTFGLLGLL
jgi:hypothetical protein